VANLVIKDGAGNTKYLKAAGAGSDGDPHVPEQTIGLPTGASTAANQSTAIGHLANILAVLGGTLTVDAGTVTINLPAGASTAANQSTIIGHVDGIEALLTTMDADTSALAGAVAGTEVQVDVVSLPNVTVGAALPAGTNNIGDVDIASIAAGDNNIGNVDVASVTIPTTIYHGQTTVAAAGTEVALAASQAILSGVTIKALHANTGMIFVGKNPVSSTTGYVLDAGESVFLEVANLATVYIDSSVNGEGVSYVAS